MALSHSVPVAERPNGERGRCNDLMTYTLFGVSQKEDPMRSFVIGALVVAVAVLGYLYWDAQHNTVFKAPGVEIKKN
jgi:hypothetical protein